MQSFPPMGLGTMKIDEAAPIAAAIESGYRHLDTAQLYGNEATVGEAIADADVDREELFVATKLWYDTLEYEAVFEATAESRELLGLDTIDLLYVHRPVAEYDPAETLQAFDELVDRGEIRHVGLSNFTRGELATARDRLDAPVFAHQIELHPLFFTEELVADSLANDEAVVAYSPLAGGRLGEIDVLGDVAERHDATRAQVALAWLVEKGVHPIPKSGDPDRQRANLAAAELALDDADVAAIDAIEREDEIYPE